MTTSPSPARPRPHLRLVLGSGLAVVALTGAFLAGTRLAAGTPAATPVPPGSPVAASASCAGLLDSWVERGVRRVGPWGWDGGFHPASEGGDAGSRAGSSAEDSLASAPSTERQVSEATGTNVQESGVDEPDVVKTDGRVLHRVNGDDLVTWDVAGERPRRLGSTDLPGDGPAEVLLVGDQVVALAPGAEPGTTAVTWLDARDPAALAVEHVDTYDGDLLAARLHDGVVRLVLDAGLPDLGLVEPGDGWGPFGRDDDDALEVNRERVRASVVADWLPTVRRDGGAPEPLLGCDDVAVPDDEDPVGTTAVVALDPAGAGAEVASSATGLAADVDLAYASADRLFLASGQQQPTEGWSGWEEWRGDAPTSSWAEPAPERTSLWSLATDGAATRWAARTRLDGVLRDRWSVDEAGGLLRVALEPSSWGGSDAGTSVVVLREEGGDLVETGRLDGLGRGEDLTSVRWSDDLALLVTFRQVDPLHAVDLSDPSSPRQLGELEVPGFSSYLHPLGERRLLGVGEGPGRGGWGAQVGLFDVGDLADLRRVDALHWGAGSRALAGEDPRQLTWLPERRTVLTVVESARGTASLAVVRLGDGRLTDSWVPVLGDAAAARVVPLPDGRVVLTGESSVGFVPL